VKRTSNLFKLLKLSQENNSEAWQAVLTEVTDPSVPSGFGLEGIGESAESAKDLEAKINEVKESPGTFSADDAKDLEEVIKTLPLEIETIIPDSITHFCINFDFKICLVFRSFFCRHLTFKHYFFSRFYQSIYFIIKI
jgi:hypothetical protein